MRALLSGAHRPPHRVIILRRVHLSRLDLPMPQRPLYQIEVTSFPVWPGRKRMPQGVDGKWAVTPVCARILLT